ncbi:hypothetical protein COT72_02430 [archaeon CG10_big_fil_rev_8_21_14_0_10_43_11]|nr:MAG: hypothetical protein COT72_02430 [archaeon CG10_big_fil_rev_8_21_14_0_10_43_11]
MVKISVANFDLLKSDEEDYIKKQTGMFLEKVGAYIPEIAVLDLRLNEVRKKQDNFKGRFDVRMTSTFGEHQAHAEGWDMIKTFMGALKNLEKQVKKDRKRNAKT